MTRGLSHEIKRVVAGVCALTLVSGTVPVQPLADIFNSVSLTASAGIDYTMNDLTALYNEVYGWRVANQNQLYNYDVVNMTNYDFYLSNALQDVKEFLTTTTQDQMRINDEYAYLKYIYVSAKSVLKTQPTYAPVLATDLGYDGDPKALVTSNGENAAGGTIHYLYKKSTDTSWTAVESGYPQATDAGTYQVAWYSDENETYAAKGSATEPIVVEGTVTIERADPTVTAPTGGSVSYTGSAVALLTNANKGSTTGGTLKYGLEKSDIALVKNDTNSAIQLESVAVDTIYYPANSNIYFPYGYKVIVQGYDHTFTPYNLNTGYVCLNNNDGIIYVYCYEKGLGGEYYYLAGGFNALKVKSISDDNIITVEAVNAEDETVDWETTVPNATDPGDYKVYYKVFGDDNYKDTAPAYVTSTIDYAAAPLTVQNLGDNFKVVEVDGDELAPDQQTGAFTIKGTKSYYIYTDNSIANDTVKKYKLDASLNQDYGEHTYNYRYTLAIPAVPEEGYLLNHTISFVGKVYTQDQTKLYVADGATPDMNEANLAAELKGSSTYYYGDTVSADDVDIKAAFSDYVKVSQNDEGEDEVYLEKANGQRVDISDGSVDYGSYKLTTKMTVDTDGDADFTTGTLDQGSATLYRNVEYSPRPMAENDYYLTTEDGDIPLTVNKEEKRVIVPEKYWVEKDPQDGSDPEIVTVEPADEDKDNWIEKSVFTYDGTAKKPEITVKNGGNDAEVKLTTEYTSAVKEETNAGKHTFALTAVAGDKANYTDAVTVEWTISKFDVSEYITAVPKNNVKTAENAEENDAIVYDGEVLDGTDFEVKTNDKYKDLAADSLEKKMVDEFIAGLTPVGTAAAKTTATAEPASAANVVKSSYFYSNKYLNFCGFSIYELYGYGSTDADDIVVFPDGTEKKVGTSYTNAANIYISSNGEIHLGNSPTGQLLGSLPNTTDYGWYVEQTGTRVIGQDTDQKTVKVFTIYAKEYPAGEMKDAGDYTAKVTVTNSNFEDVVIKDVATTIAKRDVTITPGANSMVYRDTDMPELSYTVEEAKEGSLTGVVADDMELFQSKKADSGVESAPVINAFPKRLRGGSTSTFLDLNKLPAMLGSVTVDTPVLYVDKLVQTDTSADEVKFKYADESYKTAGLNDAGKYTYAAKDFKNYNVKFPENGCNFTVAPLALNKIEDLNIVLEGISDGWTQDGNSGSYVYSGTTKAVTVTKVEKSGTRLDDEFDVVMDTYDKTNKKIETDNGGVMNYDVAHQKNGTEVYNVVVGHYNNNNKDYDFTITPPEGTYVKSITVYDDTHYPDGLEIAVNGAIDTAVSFRTAYEATEDADWDNFILRLTNVKATYAYPDEYVLELDKDYTIGGNYSSASVGRKEVQVRGTGNYKGVASAYWEIKSAEVDMAELTFKNATESFDGYDYVKTYDGVPVKPQITFAQPNSEYAKLADIEYKYYLGKYTKEEIEDPDFDGTEVDVPVNAIVVEDEKSLAPGIYTVVATVECDGFDDQVFVKTLRIDQADIHMPEDAAKTMNYGDAFPTVTQEDLDSVEGVTRADRAAIEKFLADGKLVFAYVQKYDQATMSPVNDTTKLTIKLSDDASEEDKLAFAKIALNYKYLDLYWPLETRAKSIRDSSVNVKFTNGDTIILDEDGNFASNDIIVVKDTAILDDNGEPTVLTEGKDYDLNIETTAKSGVYTLEIVGKGNYKFIRKETFHAMTAFEAATKLIMDDPVATVNAKGVGRVTVTATREVEDGFTIEEAGFIYVKDASDDVELTLDTVGKGDVKKYVVTNTNGSFTLHITDPDNKGARAVAYITVSKGDNSETIYTNEVKTSYNELKMDEAVDTGITDAFATVNAKNVGRVSATFDCAVDDGYTVVEKGMLYVKNANCKTELALENVNKNGIGKKVITSDDAYTLHITDPDGKGGLLRGYVTVQKGDLTKTYYTDTVGGTYNGIKMDESVQVNISEAYATVNSKNIGRVSATFDCAVADGYTVVEKGMLYVKNADCDTELTLDNLNTDGISKKVITTNDAYTLHVTDPTDSGAELRGFVTVTDGKITKTYYTDTVGGRYVDLAGKS